MTAPRRFGRARRLSLARRCTEIAFDATYAGGWAARLAHRFGVQGELHVSDHTVTLPRWRGATPLRAVFASDFHAGPLTDARLLDDACNAIIATRPEVLLLGGDFVSFHGRHVEALARRLACIRPPLGTYAVLGNHDLLADDTWLVERLAEAGVQVLVNRTVPLPAPWEGLALCGFDDPVQGFPAPEPVFAAAGDRARLVLIHAPEGLLDLRGHTFDLALCGHTHGGQIALPGGQPIRMPGPRINRRYSRGRFTLPEHGGTLLVSRGIGCSDLPIRLFADPEVHALTLVPGLPATGAADAAPTSSAAA